MGFIEHCEKLNAEKLEEGVGTVQTTEEMDMVIRRSILAAGIDPEEVEKVGDLIAKSSLEILLMNSKMSKVDTLYHILKGLWVDGVVTGATFIDEVGP